MRKIWETGIILFAAMGFWGMIYPDLCFTEDVCSVVCEETEGAEEGYEMEADGNGTAAGGGEDGVNNNGDRAGANGGGGEADGRVNAEKDIFTRICSAESEQIRIKSKFLEMIGPDAKAGSSTTGRNGVGNGNFEK